MLPIDDGKGSHMRWIFNTDLKFKNLHTSLLNKLLPLTHKGFVEFLKVHVENKFHKTVTYDEEGNPSVADIPLEKR